MYLYQNGPWAFMLLTYGRARLVNLERPAAF